MDPVAIDVERKLWHSAFSLVCAIVGSSAGLYCVFRLPLMIQLFHPGSFLLALFFCMVLFAWPLVVAELAIGQKFRLSAVPALGLMLPGGRGIAFSSVLIGSLLTAAYSSSSLALVVSPGFDELVNRYTASPSTTGAEDDFPSITTSLSTLSTTSATTQASQTMTSFSNSSWNSASSTTTAIPDTGAAASSLAPQSTAVRGGDWYSLLALFTFWLLASYMSWRFSNHAPLLSRILMPLPLLLWCVVAVFASMVVENSELFRELLLPNSISFWDGKLWVNAAGQALLLLQVGTGVTITFGSKSKSVHSVVNVSIAIMGVALLFAFFVTVSSAGSIAIINNQNFTARDSAFSSYSSLLTTTQHAAAPTSTLTTRTASTSFATRSSSSSSSSTTASPTSSLSSSSWTTAYSTEHAIVSATSSSAQSVLTTSSPSTKQVQETFFARQYYSAATILPALFVQAGSGSRAFGVIVYVVVLVVGILSMSLLLSSFCNSMADLHVALRSPLTSFAAAAVCFAIGAPFAFQETTTTTAGSDRNSPSSIVLLSLDQAVVGACLPLLVFAEAMAVAFGGWGGPSAMQLLREMLTEDLPISGKLIAGFTILRDFGSDERYDNLLSGAASSTSLSPTSGGGTGKNGSSRYVSPVGRFTIFILPFCLKVFVPICSTICTVVTIVTFAQDEAKTKAAEAVFAVVVVLTGLSVYFVAIQTPPNASKPQPWVEMGVSSSPVIGGIAVARVGGIGADEEDDDSDDDDDQEERFDNIGEMIIDHSTPSNAIRSSGSGADGNFDISQVVHTPPSASNLGTPSNVDPYHEHARTGSTKYNVIIVPNSTDDDAHRHPHAKEWRDDEELNQSLGIAKEK